MTKYAALAAHDIRWLRHARSERRDAIAAEFTQRMKHGSASGFLGAQEDEAVAVRNQHEAVAWKGHCTRER